MLIYLKPSHQRQKLLYKFTESTERWRIKCAFKPPTKNSNFEVLLNCISLMQNSYYLCAFQCLCCLTVHPKTVPNSYTGCLMVVWDDPRSGGHTCVRFRGISWSKLQSFHSKQTPFNEPQIPRLIVIIEATWEKEKGTYLAHLLVLWLQTTIRDKSACRYFQCIHVFNSCIQMSNKDLLSRNI